MDFWKVENYNINFTFLALIDVWLDTKTPKEFKWIMATSIHPIHVKDRSTWNFGMMH